ncbi:hypothetical protein B0H19DRAFT_1099679 [Mycena capillaripes]|nr:hypothetical protein B0H19DRAFT_1099679 [Mycena capillaripes]
MFSRRSRALLLTSTCAGWGAALELRETIFTQIDDELLNSLSGVGRHSSGQEHWLGIEGPHIAFMRRHAPVVWRSRRRRAVA